MMDWSALRGRTNPTDKKLANAGLCYSAEILHDARQKLAKMAAARQDVAEALEMTRTQSEETRAVILQEMGLKNEAIAIALNAPRRRVPHLLDCPAHVRENAAFWAGYFIRKVET